MQNVLRKLGKYIGYVLIAYVSIYISFEALVPAGRFIRCYLAGIKDAGLHRNHGFRRNISVKEL
jgi:hypothetical protein